MKTLKNIMDNEAVTDAQKVIQAAFWAGQSDMRGTSTEEMREAIKSVKYGRYHKEQKRVIAHIINKCGTLNVGGIDSGKAEAAEILEWDFDI